MVATPQPAAVPTSTPPPDSGAQLSALLNGAGVAALDETGWIRVTGDDRVRWLNGMVTNSIQHLAPGEGCYNFVLNAQGRIQGDLTAFLLDNSILLETSDAGRLATLLDHFIIMDDVELEVLCIRAAEEKLPHNRRPFPVDRRGLMLVGPEAGSHLRAVEMPVPSDLSLVSTSWHGQPVDVLHTYSPLVPRFELWADPPTIAAITAELLATGAAPIEPQALEALRILSGTPRYGVDIRNSETARDLPQETGQTRALHFTKGCYLGQEIVERIRSRGSVHRAFTGFELTGALPAPGTTLQAGPDAKAVGELTSVAAIDLPDAPALRLKSGPVQLALGYIRREALADAQARGLPLEYPGGTATPIALPYVNA
jgi:folate-binding protein YgfZ